MANLTSTLIARLIDNISGPANAAAGALRRLVGASNATSTARSGTLAALNRDISLLHRNTEKLSGSLAGPLALIGAFGFKTAFEFEKAGNKLEALGDATAAQRRELEAFANTLNAKYPQSLTEIIKTGTELLKAGLNFQQMLGALDPTLATAIIGDMKPSEVANMISAAINAFQLPKETTEQALRSTTTIADRMTYASIKTTATLRDMGEMFKYVAAAAAATGSTIDDVTAIAMAFSANGVNGSFAGVALRSAIVRLAKGGTATGRAALARVGMEIPKYQRGRQPVTGERILSQLEAGGIDARPIAAQIEAITKDPSMINSVTRMAARITALVQEHLTKTGSALDASQIAQGVQDSIIAAGSKIDLLRFFTDLKEKMAKNLLTGGDLTQILEGRHFSNYMALMTADLAKLKAEIEANAGGYSQSRYGTMLQGIVGPTYEFTAAIEKLTVALGRAVFPDVAKGFTALADAATRLSESNPEVLKFSVYAGLMIVALIPLGIAISAITSIVGLAVGAFGLLAGAVALVSLPILLLGVAIAGAGLGLYLFRDKIYSFFDGLAEKMRSGLDTARTWGAGFMSSIQSSMESGSSALFGWIRNWGVELITTFKVGLSPLFELGADLMGSFWEGMKSKAGAMMGWLAGIGARIKAALSFGRGSAATTPEGQQGTTPRSMPGRAAGGPVSRGMSYLVGERRPEIFTPNTDGYVHARAGRGGSSASISVPVSISVSGVSDPRAAAEEAVRLFEARTSALLRGVMADMGVALT